jgi:hypothetical protein
MREKPPKLLSALYGGIIMAFISAVPILNFLNCLCCAGVMLGGFFAVFFYKKDLLPDMEPLSSSDCLQLGALAGVFGAVIGGLLTAAVFAMFGNETARMIMEFLEPYREEMPPGALDELEQVLSGGGLSILSLIVGMIIDVIFGLLGGLIGYSILKPKQVAS